jgi:hypothetical protein
LFFLSFFLSFFFKIVLAIWDPLEFYMNFKVEGSFFLFLLVGLGFVVRASYLQSLYVFSFIYLLIYYSCSVGTL